MRRRSGRFSRQWQRERAARANDEREDVNARLRWAFGGNPFGWRWRQRGERVLPYRGFRAGRARERPDDTGYDEPAAPEPVRDEWHGNRWLAGMSDLRTNDGVIGDDPDEYPGERV
ncbi:hypothetical protein EV193_102611 [Herbihabitans rhizosphaerae]|uniref:Uncharacterized protein n=1 Tax=Herbihabitans rhizosphaerae TaxID=1872711 RepID=A0A4Q7L4C4_9PSEU|nr:hypothetical protein [Herbihabitans rhizosphaerae]RZS43630.1 hypothetical protein EV193_102611 [Herbihabitans rhizosphaerae]